jgi:hypothetical protein
VDLAVRAVLAFTGAQQQHTGQGGGRAGHVHDAGTGEVGEAQITQVVHAEHVVAAPGPGAFHRVDETGHDHRERQEGPQLHTLCHGTGNDRHGGGDEHHLEEEVGRAGVNRAAVKTRFRGVRQHTGQIKGFNAVQEDAAAVHDRITADQVHQAGDGEQRHVLGENFGGVFSTHQAGFEHREARRHPHYQCATHQKIKGVDGVLKFKDLIFHVATLRELEACSGPWHGSCYTFL